PIPGKALLPPARPPAVVHSRCRPARRRNPAIRPPAVLPSAGRGGEYRRPRPLRSDWPAGRVARHPAPPPRSATGRRDPYRHTKASDRGPFHAPRPATTIAGRCPDALSRSLTATVAPRDRPTTRP